MPTNPPAGVWLSYYSDGSAATPHGAEIDAYRYALPRAQSVLFVPFGMTIREAEDA